MATKNDRLLRVMVDSNILVAGTGWPRFPYEVLQHAIRGDFQLVLTEYVIDEARTHIVDLVPEMLVRFERLLKSAIMTSEALEVIRHRSWRDFSD